MLSMLFTNTSDHTINLDAVGLDPVGPKGDVEIPLPLAAPYRKDNGHRGPSPIEQVAPQLEPKDPEDLKVWKRIPAPPIPESRVVSVTARAPSESPGVKALREKREADVAKALAKPAAPAGKAQG